jgi:putative CocE/NonD family hydrolase
MIHDKTSNARKRVPGYASRVTRLSKIVAATMLLAGCALAANAPIDAAWLRANYTKREVMIPMRDGVKLFTAIYAPQDDSSQHPIVLKRTPYSCRPYGPDAFPDELEPDPELARAGYIFVIQDARGTHMSEGTWIHMRPHLDRKSGPKDIDESTDGFDTIDWLIKNMPNNNGRVGMHGGSYPGFYVLSSMIDAHPALKCVVPAAPQTDWWREDIHLNGAFHLSPVFWFVREMGLARPAPTTQHERAPITSPSRDGYEFFLRHVGSLNGVNERFFDGKSQMWADIAAHPNRDEFWQIRDLRPHLKNVAPAVLNVGGWYDESNLFGTLAAYRTIEKQDPNALNVLVMGPWEHMGWEFNNTGDRYGDHALGSATSQHFRAMQRKFLDTHLLEVNGKSDLPEATMFETGTNQWRTFDTWPPKTQPLRLHARDDQRLLEEAPRTASREFDEFISDPRKPVPFTEQIVMTKPDGFLAADERFAARRPDVLVYETEPLAEAITVAGPIEVELWVSTDRDDADWLVKLIDVFPGNEPDWPDMRAGTRTGGYQMLVRLCGIRGRYRNDPSSPAPFVPSEPSRVRFELPDVLHTFRPGHSIMIQVQSSWFPMLDRNPQKWVDNIFLADDDDFVKANHRVYRCEGNATRLTLPVMR